MLFCFQYLNSDCMYSNDVDHSIKFIYNMMDNMHVADGISVIFLSNKTTVLQLVAHRK